MTVVGSSTKSAGSEKMTTQATTNTTLFSGKSTSSIKIITESSTKSISSTDKNTKGKRRKCICSLSLLKFAFYHYIFSLNMQTILGLMLITLLKERKFICI